MNQAALITGMCGIIAALVVTLPSRRGPASPFFEIQGMGEAGQIALAKLALDPTRPLLDSVSFAELEQTLFIDDSLGVAFSRPLGQEWTVGNLGQVTTVSSTDIPLLGLFAEAERNGWPSDTLARQLHNLGARRDHPVKITLTAQTRIGSVELGTNPFRDGSYAVGWLKMIYGESFVDLPRDTVVANVRQMVVDMDSIIGARLPISKELYSGVFIAQAEPGSFQSDGLLGWMNWDLLESVARHSRAGPSLPSMLLVNREQGFAIVNESYTIVNAIVNGTAGSTAIVNRLGYAVRSGEAVYLVLLQYVSADSQEIVTELERVFRSVRLRAAIRPPGSHSTN
jgi:hypothetical protein